MTGEPSHYEVLGIAETATAEEVRAAYRARARALHPDRVGEAGAAAMARLNEAYRTLRDADRRRAYDRARRGATAPAPAVRAARPASAAPAPPATPGATGCLLGALVALVVLVAAVVGLAFPAARDRGPDPVDGDVGTGSCLALARDGSLREVSCDGPHDAVVVDVVAPDQTCPPGTRTAASPIRTARLCLV